MVTPVLRRFRREMRLATVWSAGLALVALPFVHAHAVDPWSHTGDHVHPVVVHSVFSSEPVAHYPEDPQPSAAGQALVVSHGLGYELASIHGPTPVPTVGGAVSPAGALRLVSLTRRQIQVEGSPPASVLDSSNTSRAPPVRSFF